MATLTELGKPTRGTHERVVAISDPASGLEAIVAIHSTARGPAFGGCRMAPYPSRRAALRDALRLSQAMSRKAAIAGLPFGGGKCVVIGNPATQKSPALLLALAEGIDRLQGHYLTADDIGTTVRDMELMRTVTPFARGLPLPSGEACPAAYGTFLALRAAVAHRHGTADLSGCRVAVQGLGKLGMRLCHYLHDAGAKLFVADPQAERLDEAVGRFGATPVPIDRILSTEADVLSPNAFGDVLCDATLPRIRAGIVVGGANNQLRSPRHGVELHRRGILYVPDYVANAGGLIDVAMEGPAYRPAEVLRACDAIRHTTGGLLREAQHLRISPAELADQIAADRMVQPHSAIFRIDLAALVPA